MNDVEQIEISITDAKEKVALGDALERLLRNADFQTIIMTGYFEKEAVRLVMAKSLPSMARPEQQEAINKSIDAVGTLYQYFSRIDKEADLAVAAIQDGEDALSEMAETGEV